MHNELVTHIADRTGHVWAELVWRDRTLDHLMIGDIVVDGAIVDDPLLGPCHVIGDRTVMTAIDWARPAQIPTVAAPARLPAGTGGVLLNAIALLAERAGVAALRYGGPYPTSALWRALARSFRCTSSEAEFTSDVLGRASRVARDELPIDFTPAPCERVAIARGYVELRDGLERAVIDGIGYERDGSPARLVDGRAEVWFGDRVYAHVATFDHDELVDGPHAIPSCTSDVVGRAFPAELRAAIGELVADAVPSPLARDARRVVEDRAMRWADLGARAARAHDGFEIHAAIWQHVAPHGLARVALAIAEAVTPIVTQTVLAEVMSA